MESPFTALRTLYRSIGINTEMHPYLVRHRSGMVDTLLLDDRSYQALKERDMIDEVIPLADDTPLLYSTAPLLCTLQEQICFN